jgi:hypothetical protein
MRMEETISEVGLELETAQLLTDLLNVQDELLDVLAQKRDRMGATDLEGMLRTQDREEQLCQRLEACQQRRRELLARAGEQGLPHESIGQLAVALGPPHASTIGKQVRDASTRLRLLQHHSLTNWVLAQRTLLHLAQMLEIIASGGRLQPTYGKDQAPPWRGSLVDEAA